MRRHSTSATSSSSSLSTSSSSTSSSSSRLPRHRRWVASALSDCGTSSPNVTTASRWSWWTLVLVVLLLLVFPPRVLPLMCHIGIGQRGKLYQNSIGWTRSCPKAKYCFEVVTKDINKVKKLFEYPWDSYYDSFYVRSCGGDYGTNTTWHPYKGLPKLTRHKVGMVKVNITTPQLISGQGGKKNTVEMNLRWKCKKDLCTKYSAASFTSRVSITTATVATIAVVTTMFLLF